MNNININNNTKNNLHPSTLTTLPTKSTTTIITTTVPHPPHHTYPTTNTTPKTNSTSSSAPPKSKVLTPTTTTSTTVTTTTTTASSTGSQLLLQKIQQLERERLIHEHSLRKISEQISSISATIPLLERMEAQYSQSPAFRASVHSQKPPTLAQQRQYQQHLLQQQFLQQQQQKQLRAMSSSSSNGSNGHMKHVQQQQQQQLHHMVASTASSSSSSTSPPTASQHHQRVSSTFPVSSSSSSMNRSNGSTVQRTTSTSTPTIPPNAQLLSQVINQQNKALLLQQQQQRRSSQSSSPMTPNQTNTMSSTMNTNNTNNGSTMAVNPPRPSHMPTNQPLQQPQHVQYMSMHNQKQQVQTLQRGVVIDQHKNPTSIFSHLTTIPALIVNNSNNNLTNKQNTTDNSSSNSSNSTHSGTIIHQKSVNPTTTHNNNNSTSGNIDNDIKIIHDDDEDETVVDDNEETEVEPSDIQPSSGNSSDVDNRVNRRFNRRKLLSRRTSTASTLALSKPISTASMTVNEEASRDLTNEMNVIDALTPTSLPESPPSPSSPLDVFQSDISKENNECATNEKSKSENKDETAPSTIDQQGKEKKTTKIDQSSVMVSPSSAIVSINLNDDDSNDGSQSHDEKDECSHSQESSSKINNNNQDSNNFNDQHVVEPNAPVDDDYEEDDNVETDDEQDKDRTYSPLDSEEDEDMENEFIREATHGADSVEVLNQYCVVCKETNRNFSKRYSTRRHAEKYKLIFDGYDGEIGAVCCSCYNKFYLGSKNLNTKRGKRKASSQMARTAKKSRSRKDTRRILDEDSEDEIVDPCLIQWEGKWYAARQDLPRLSGANSNNAAHPRKITKYKELTGTDKDPFILVDLDDIDLVQKQNKDITIMNFVLDKSGRRTLKLYSVDFVKFLKKYYTEP